VPQRAPSARWRRRGRREEAREIGQKARGTATAIADNMGNKSEELKDRIEAKKHELMARLAELKADSRAEAREQSSRIKLRLDELEDYLREGWDKAQLKLNEWLNRKNN
jgi:hypothetical protein